MTAFAYGCVCSSMYSVYAHTWVSARVGVCAHARVCAGVSKMRHPVPPCVCVSVHILAC